jgi:hypothetical protein
MIAFFDDFVCVSKGDVSDCVKSLVTIFSAFQKSNKQELAYYCLYCSCLPIQIPHPKTLGNLQRGATVGRATSSGATSCVTSKGTNEWSNITIGKA